MAKKSHWLRWLIGVAALLLAVACAAFAIPELRFTIANWEHKYALERPFDSTPDEATSVLFLGNSRTFFNGMPRMVDQLSAAAEGPAIWSDLESMGGVRLSWHWHERGSAERVGDYDVVALQPRRCRDEELAYVKRFADRAAPDAEVLLLCGWSTTMDRTRPPRDREEKLRRKVAPKIASMKKVRQPPFGRALEAARDAGISDRVLFLPDHHPSVAGSFLMACVYYRAISRRPCSESGWSHPELDPDLTKTLKSAADRAFRQDDGYSPAK